MQQFNIADFLPLFPWEGPPLPRFLRFFWPWLQGGQSSLPALSPRKYISSIGETAIAPYKAPLATYENEEEWQISWNQDGLPETIKVTRHAKKT